MEELSDKFVKKFNPLPPPPTAEQQKILEQFRKEISAHLTPEEVSQLDDATYYRFLRARKYHLKESTKMLVHFIKWRKEFGTIDISDPKVNLVSKWGVYYILPHTDRFGRPIVIFNFRRYNPTKRDLDGTIKLFVYELEHIISLMKPGIERMLVILDMQGYKLRNNDIACARVCLNIFQDCYPERLGAAIVVNHSWIFWAFWNLIKPFLDKNTCQKIHFLDQKEITETLSKIVDLDLLPEQFGGKYKLSQPIIDAWEDEKNENESDETSPDPKSLNNTTNVEESHSLDSKEDSDSTTPHSNIHNTKNSSTDSTSSPQPHHATDTDNNSKDNLDIKAKI